MLGNIKLNELVLKKCKINKELYYYLGLLWLIVATQSEKYTQDGEHAVPHHRLADGFFFF